MEIPNLASRSRQYTHYLVKRYAWSIKTAVNPKSTGEHGWLFVYVIASAVYRTMVATAIIWFIADKMSVIPSRVFARRPFARSANGHSNFSRIRRGTILTALSGDPAVWAMFSLGAKVRHCADQPQVVVDSVVQQRRADRYTPAGGATPIPNNPLLVAPPSEISEFHDRC